MKYVKPLLLFVSLIALAGCSMSGGSTMNPPGSQSPATQDRKPMDSPGSLPGLPLPGGGLDLSGQVVVQLCDAAPLLGNLVPTEIDLGILRVDVVSHGQVTTVASFKQPNVVNVLEYQNGNAASIAIGNVDLGLYDEMHFVVDTASSRVVANGINYPINFTVGGTTHSSVGAGGATQTMSSAPGTVTMIVHARFDVNGVPARVVQVDFNTFESLALASNGTIVSQPALFASPTQVAGGISGTIVNANGDPVAQATVVALNARGEVANTTATGSDGSFFMHTLRAGHYRLLVFNSYETASGQVVKAANATGRDALEGPSLQVKAGETTSVGTVQD